MIRMMLLIPLAAVLMACGLVSGVESGTEVVATPVAPTVEEPAPTEEPVVESTIVVTGEGPPIRYAGDSLIEEKIIEFPVVVRATLSSISSDTFSYPDGYFLPVLMFNLNVIEYLAGSGPTSIVAVWFGPDYKTREEADASRADLLAERDSQWDDRESVIFLFDLSTLPPNSTQPQLSNKYSLGAYSTIYFDDQYSLYSESYKKWLPAVPGTGPGDDQEFLLDVPPTTETITLGDLKKRITNVTAEYNGGDGSDRYRECVLEKYRYIRNQRHWPERRGTPYGLWTLDYNIVSGQAAGTVLDQKEAYGGYPDDKLSYWIEGGDSTLFDTADGASTVIDKDGDGQDNEGDVIKYDKMVRLERPLPAGEYGFDLKESQPRFTICNFVISNEWSVTVTSPTGVLHELLFDPVTVGSSIAADDTNGVLKPAYFTGGDGSSATIGRISYEPPSSGSGQAGTVKLAITAGADPDDLLGGRLLDFIELDGTVSLSLYVAAATVDSANDTLSWTVSSQPWDDGDKLMVRIRRAPPS